MKFEDGLISRLSEKVLEDFSGLSTFRQTRFDMVQECAGHRYGDNGARRPVKLNLMALYQATVARNLISKSPKIHLGTFQKEHRPAVNAMESWCNRQIERQRLAETFQRIVIDAMYGPGIAKISLASPADAAMTAWGQKAGTARIQRIDLDDFVYDLNAKDFSEPEFIGHRLRVPIRVARKMYGRSAKFEQRSDPDYNDDGDERIGRLTRNYSGFKELEDHVELWEIYLPRHRMIVILSADCVYRTGRDGLDKPLWSHRWIGRDSGPYEILSFGIVPGNAMPKAPFMDLFDIHMDCNNAKRKSIESMRDVKELTAVRRNNDGDMRVVMNSKHLDMIPLDDPDGVRPFMTGGKSVQFLEAGANARKEDFSFIGGNLELMAGRSQQAGTAHQEELLQRNSSASIADMQDRVSAWLEKCIASFVWYGWHDPRAVYEVPFDEVPGVELVRKVHPAGHPTMGRNAEFDELDLRIVPFSYQAKTPAETLAFMNAVVDRAMPMMPLLQSQGIIFDANFWMNALAKLGDCPDLAQLFITSEPPEGDEAKSLPHDKIMPSNTTRTVNRVNASQRTQPGTAKQAILNGLDLGGSQNGESKNGWSG